MKPELEDILQHYGVKGMKWKNRKDENVEEAIEQEDGESETPDFSEFMVDEFLDDIKKLGKNVGKKISNLDDVIKKFGSKSLKSLFKSKSKTTVLDTSDVKKLKEQLKGSRFKVNENTPYKNAAFQEAWNNREAERAKVDKLLKKGRIDSKTAKSMKADIDKETKKTLQRKERNKNMTMKTEVQSVNGKAPSSEVSNSKAPTKTKNNSSKKTLGDWAGTSMAAGSKEEKEFNKWVKDNGYTKSNVVRPKNEQTWRKDKKITITTEDWVINGKPKK